MNIYERDTPRCNALESNPLDSFDYRAWIKLARQLEQELDTCRDAHMANCLAADTLRREIRELREQFAALEKE